MNLHIVFKIVENTVSMDENMESKKHLDENIVSMKNMKNMDV